jgi:hypothetical protein
MSKPLIPIAVSSQLDSTGEERIHMADTPEFPPPSPLGFLSLTGDIVNGYVGESGTYQYIAHGASGAYTVEVIAGALPDGAVMDDQGLVIYTYTTTGDFAWTLRVTDSRNRTFDLNDNNTIYAISLTGDLPDGAVGDIISYDYTSTGTIFTIVSGSLPPGTVLNSDGTVTGTYTTAGNYSWTVHAETSGGAFAELADTADVIGIFGTPPSGGIGTAYSYTLTGDGGVPPYTFTLESGTLPGGLTLGSDGDITGTPTTEESQTFVVRITDDNGLTTTGEFTIAILSLGITGDLPDQNINATVSFDYVAVGGTGPYTFSIVSGSLPTGLSMNSSGHVSGTASTAGSYSWTVRVMDSLALTADDPDTCLVTRPLYVVGSNNRYVFTSPTALAGTWTQRDPGAAVNWTVACGTPQGSVLLAGGTGVVASSSDGGLTWTTSTSIRDDLGVTVYLNRITPTQLIYSKNLGLHVCIVTTDGSGTYILTSADNGISWINRKRIDKAQSLAEHEGYIVIVTGSLGAGTYVTSDAITYTKVNTTNQLSPVVYYNGEFLACYKSSSTYWYAASAPVTSWVLRASTGATRASGAVSTESNIIINGADSAGTNKGIYVSTDSAATWSKKFSGNTLEAVSGIAYVNGTTIVATGTSGSGVDVSTDGGNTWTNVAMPTGSVATNCAWAGVVAI